MSKRSIHKAIQNGAKSLHFYPNNPRMVPKGLTPNVHKMHITVHTKYDARAAKGKAATAVPQKSHITGMLQTKGTSKQDCECTILHISLRGFLSETMNILFSI